ncbi:MAG TPA: hypothetical protein VK524_14350, partial [Polyangiaceae bacterium]|nr:hypothetical protein [Polyangiaceae bacterium]
TGGKLGTFCVNCHAPMAVREGATEDGLNLDTLPQHLKGITCYFCHNIQRVDADHNNRITLANDETMRGAVRDPVRNGKHRSAYSGYMDRDALKSSDACGACHDLRLTAPHFDRDVHLERTFEEWRQTVFNQEGAAGQRCGSCHMPESSQRGPIADLEGVPLQVRPRHLHDFPGVDLALTPFPEDAPQNEQQLERVQRFLDTTLSTEVCVAQSRGVIRVLLDNANAGHHFPSGASQDRRVWVSVKAYVDTREVFSTVDVPEGQSVTTAAAAQAGQLLWLMRDEVVKENGEEAHMFWDVARVVPREESASPTIPGTLAVDPFNSSHLVRRFPSTGALPAADIPDRVVVNIFVRPIDYDVIDDLIQSKDLDPRFRNELRTLALLPNRGTTSPRANVNLEWTRERARREGFAVPLPGEQLLADCLTPAGRRP